MRHFELPLVLSKHWCRYRVAILAFFWIVGLLCGVSFASVAKDFDFPQMRSLAYSRVSIAGLAAVLVFPLTISAVAVYLNVPVFLFPICFLKAFSFGYCLYSISVAFGDAGWLVRVLLLFSDSCMMVPLLWFWCRHQGRKRKSIKRDLTVCTSFAALIGVTDYYLISPYLVELMNYL